MNETAKKLDDHTIQFVRILPGPIEKIWSYLVDSEKRGQWFAKGDLPAKIGEPFELHFKHSDLSPYTAPPPEKMRDVDKNGHAATNILLKLEPPNVLAFTFGPRTRPDSEKSQVEIRLTQEGDPKDNKVRLTLTHSRIPDHDYEISISGGWHSHLEVLQYRAEGKVPPAFWDIWRQTDDVYERRDS